MAKLTIVYDLADGENAHDLIHSGRNMAHIAWTDAVSERDRLRAEAENERVRATDLARQLQIAIEAQEAESSSPRPIQHSRSKRSPRNWPGFRPVSAPARRWPRQQPASTRKAV